MQRTHVKKEKPDEASSSYTKLQTEMAKFSSRAEGKSEVIHQEGTSLTSSQSDNLSISQNTDDGDITDSNSTQITSQMENKQLKFHIEKSRVLQLKHNEVLAKNALLFEGPIPMKSQSKATPVINPVSSMVFKK